MNMGASYVLILSCLSIAHAQPAKRDAGFYTTRFGRSDPALRMYNAQASRLLHRPDESADLAVDMPINLAELIPSLPPSYLDEGNDLAAGVWQDPQVWAKIGNLGWARIINKGGRLGRLPNQI